MLNTRSHHCKSPFFKEGICPKESENDISNDERTEMDTSKFMRSPTAQIKISGACYLLYVSCGMSIGHSSILIPQLQSNHSSIPTDKDTGTWIANVHSIAMPVGCLLGGIIMDYWGRRKTILLGAGLFAIGWWLIAAAQNHAMIFAGRIVNGYCKGFVATVGAVVIIEFSEPAIRGSLLTSMGTSFALGCGFIYGLGSFLEWRVASGVASLLPLSAMLAFFFLPESAVWLVRKYRMIEARRTLHWVYGIGRENQADIEHEDLVRRRRADEEETFRKCASFSTPVIMVIVKKWKILMTLCVLKPLFISLIYNLAQVLCGTHFIVKYAADTLFPTKIEGKGLNNYDIVVLTEVLRIPGLLSATVLMYWLGQRRLSISSGLGSSVSALILGIVLYVQTRPSTQLTENWIILITTLLYIVANSWGFFILSFIVTGELLPGKVRGVLCGCIYSAIDIFTLIYLRISDIVETYGMLWISGISSLVCTIFLYLCLPETKGRSLADLEDYFRQNNVLQMTSKVQNSQEDGRDIILHDISRTHIYI